MNVSLDLIKELRQRSQASVSDCKKALEEANSDIEKAIQLLRKRGCEIAAAKSQRPAPEGRIESYVHLGSKLGVLVEVNCETDFVAKNTEFCQFTKDLAMQIAAVAPTYIKREDVPQEVLKNIKDVEEFYKENCLLEQVFIKDPLITIKDYLVSIVAKLGENVVVRRFVRYKVGEA